MILQNIISPDTVCNTTELYYRYDRDVQIEENKIILEAGSWISTDTYMNLFDLTAWKKYSAIKNIVLSIKLSGKGKLNMFRLIDGKEEIIQSIHFQTPEGEMKQYSMEIPEIEEKGILYWKIEAAETVIIKEASYQTKQKKENDIKIAVIICTYKRKENLERTLSKLNASIFEQTGEWKKRFFVRVVDNAKELKDEYGEYISVYGNENTGGSGGFTRGMKETIKERSAFPATHVLLMDDDVELQPESLFRLYSLLSYINTKYQDEIIAGRMFRLDDRKVQYTAAEIWNGGDIRHIGWNQDMSKRDILEEVNANTGAEYGGWWFCCIPYGFVEKNKPLPFFLHCDDVEYGLRHGGCPIILNGIQVWHETYEYRQSPVITYYDTRNSLIVNELYELNFEQEIENYMLVALQYRKSEELIYGYMVRLGVIDAQKGLAWLLKINPKKNSRKIERKISKKIRFIRLENKMLEKILLINRKQKDGIIRKHIRNN